MLRVKCAKCGTVLEHREVKEIMVILIKPDHICREQFDNELTTVIPYTRK